MTRPVLKATTALTLTLSLLQPAPGLAQNLVLRQGVAGPSLGAAAPETLWRVQDCVADPAQDGCLPPEGTAVPESSVPAEEAAPAEELAPVEPEPAAPAEEIAPAEPEPAPLPEEPAPAVPEPAAPPEEVAPAEPEPAPPPEEPAPAEPEPVAPAGVMAPAEPETVAPAEDSVPVEPEPAAPVEEASPPAPEATVEEPPAPEEAAPEAGVAPGTPADPVAEVTPEPTPPLDVAPEPTATEAAVIDEMMADPTVAAAVDTLAQTVAPPAAATATAPALAAVAAAAVATAGAAPAPEAAATVTQTLQGDLARQAGQDFATPLTTAVPVQAAPGKKGLTDLEKAGLVALGAVAVGMLIGRNRVVANSGDRVVVDRGNGDLTVWKDDNANLRAPGVVETTQRYGDGSTLTTLERPDGSRIVTVRDATGRVLRRDRINRDGSGVTLIDDTRIYEPVVVSQLPRPRARELRLMDNADPAFIRALLDQSEQPGIGRTFSLDQVRAIAEVRALAPELSGRPITFASGSAALKPEDAGNLVQLAGVMNDLIAVNPAELFLIEGHTDAVGSAAYNLALSDRRAETVALALTEYFGVPAENLVIQGYGERFLKVPVATDEPANRRVAARRITWLLEG